MKRIQENDLSELIKIREKSLKFSLNNLASISYKLLSESFTFSNLRVQRINSNDSNLRIIDFIEVNERVRRVKNRNELMERLEGDFRCYGVFHELVETPVSFVFLRLYKGLPENLSKLLSREKIENTDSCIFYSISSPVIGLNGIKFGGELIKKVKMAIKTELPNIKIFATFSPIPNFRNWIIKQSPKYDHLTNLSGEQVHESKLELIECVSKYLEKSCTVDPVARFHYKNGAALGPIRFASDPSPESFKQSYGIQVHYIYSQ